MSSRLEQLQKEFDTIIKSFDYLDTTSSSSKEKSLHDALYDHLSNDDKQRLNAAFKVIDDLSYFVHTKIVKEAEEEFDKNKTI